MSSLRLSLGRLSVIGLLVILALAGCGPAETAAPAVEPAATLAPTSAPQPTETPAPTSAPLADTLAPAGVPNESYYAPFPVAVALDGSLADWEGVPRVVMPAGADQQGVPTYVSFAAAADADSLFFLGEVTDPKIISGQHGADYWNEDSIEFYLNASGDLGTSKYKDGVAQITVPPLNIGLPLDQVTLGGVSVDSTQAQAIVVKTETGYAVEVSVPLQNTGVWNIPLVHGTVLGFQVHLNGAAESDRNTKIIWSKFDTGDSSYQNPGVFGELILYEIGQTNTARVTPEPQPTPVMVAIPADAPYKQAGLPIAERVENLLSYMTLEEKVGQMTLVEKNSMANEDIAGMYIGGLLSGGGGYPASGNTPEGWAAMVDGYQSLALGSHLGIPLIYGVDAVHGHNNVNGAVIFPHNIGLGAAADPALVERIGQATALEMAATGIYWNYAPAIMVPQDIRWGRTYEGFSEDPELVSLLGAAYLRGLQGTDLSAPNTALGTPKHYVGDGGAVWGTSTTGSYIIDQGVTDVDEATLRAIHLPPYVAAIEAGARSIMISFSSWGGMKMHGQEYLIQDVLKGELGFTGFTVSDWGGIDAIAPGDYYASVVASVNAGVDMNMVPYEYERFIDIMLQAVAQGDISMERIDDAVRRILTVKFEMGLFERPYSDPAALAAMGSAEHRSLAREAVQKSLVLLKDDLNLLPLAKEMAAGRLLVAGFAADDLGVQAGGWTIEWQGVSGNSRFPGTTILQGIQAAVGPDTEVIYDGSGRFGDLEITADDICLAVVGELPYAEGVGDSRTLNLSPRDNKALRQLEGRCENLVVVIVSGRPVIVTEYIGLWDAVVAAWLPGSEGTGVSDVLFGDVPFTGTLPYTWPKTAEAAGDPLNNADPLFPRGFRLEK